MTLEWKYSLENVDWEELYRTISSRSARARRTFRFEGGVLKQHVQVFCV